MKNTGKIVGKHLQINFISFKAFNLQVISMRKFLNHFELTNSKSFAK